MPALNLTDVLNALHHAEDNNDNDDDLPTLPIIEAQIHALKGIFAAVEGSAREQTANPFQRGEPVQFIEGTGPIKYELRSKLAFAFWKYLDPAVPADRRWIEHGDHRQLDSLATINCLLVSVTSRGSLTFWPANTELLTRCI